MTNSRRIIRKTQPARNRRVDDQVWTLVLAFCVLGGFLAGTVLAYLKLDDSRWYANAWTYLIAIPLIIASAVVALALTGNRFLKRTMQLALVMGVIFHIVLFIAALETDVFHRVWTEVLASIERAPEKEVVKVPQYTKWQQDPQRRTQREFSQPVETEIPEPVVEPTPRETQQEEPADVPVEPQTAPEKPRVVQPNVVRREQVNQSVPRQRDERSKLSRRAAEMPANPTQAIQLPDLVRRPERRPDIVQPGRSGTPKVQQPLDTVRPDRPAPTVSRQDPSTQLTRRAPSKAPAQDSAAATLPRSRPQAGIAPRADVRVADKAATALETQPEALQPNNTAARKQRTQSAERRQPETLPTPSLNSEALVRRRNPRQPAPEQMSLARTPRPVESRRPRITDRPDLTSQVDMPANPSSSVQPLAANAPAAKSVSRERASGSESNPRADRSTSRSEATVSRVMPASPQRAVAESTQPQNADTNAVLPGSRTARATALGAVALRASPVAREATAESPADPAPSGVAAATTRVAKSASGNASSQRQFPSVESLGAVSQPQTAQQLSSRSTTDVRPSLNAQAVANQPPRRAARPALSASSPIAAENPARQSAAARAQPMAAGPASLVLSKAQTGTAGRGAAASLGVSDPSPDSPATVASGSAQRAMATQNVPSGPALSPHAPALVRDGRAGQRQPSAVLQATPLTPATLPGSRDPGAVNASASAALTQAASDADRGRVTASKGTLEVDIGPTTRVAQTGAGRASGGGQPQRSPGTETQSLTRSSRGVSPTASLLADAVSPAAAAPMADGGGAAESVDVAANPNAAIEARPGAAAAVLGGPAADAGGSISAPTNTMAASNRRAAIAADGPQLSESDEQVPHTGRKSSRSRQLAGDSSVADLSAGNADDRNDRELPESMLAANSAAASVGKQQVGGVADRSSEEAAEGSTAPSAEGAAQRALASRVEAVEAPPGPAAPGGGSNSPTRSALGPQLMADSRAETPEVAGGPTSSGKEDAYAQSTQGSLITRLAGGVDAPRNDERVGARPSEVVSDAAENGTVGAGTAQRATSVAAVDGPAVGSQTASSPMARRRTPAGLSVSPIAEVPGSGMPAASPMEFDEDAEPGPIADWPSVGPTSRLAGAAMPVTIDAPAGVGGLERQVTVEVGVSDRRASEVSEQVQLKPARFARRKVGGMPELNPAAAVAAEPFRRRARRGDGMGDPAVGTGPETEEAIELGLVYLSRIQTPDGRWTLDGNADRDGLPQMASDTAATGMALLAFQGAGYSHREYRYASVVRGGVEFLVGSQQPNGDLYVSMDSDSNRVVALYSHSIAALALCEAYGMTQDPALREPAQKALDFIVESQHPTRGGWRYSPQIGSDTSVTGWMMMALKSGELADLEVPADTYERIREWLNRAQLSPNQAHLYCYNPYAPDTAEQRGGRRPTTTMTSVGLLMRLYSGWRRDHPNMIRGADYLLQTPPSVGTTSSPRRDTYYWYYATQVMFHMGGQYWQAWNQRLHPMLVSSQERDGDLAGSWDPRRPVPDRWAPFAGRLYVTAMNLLSLEVTYRYLPLYDDTGK